MSDRQDRFRRLAHTNTKRKRPAPPLPPTTYNVADFDAEGNHIAPPAPAPRDEEALFARRAGDNGDRETRQPLERIVPGYEMVNAAGGCSCAETAFPLDTVRGPSPLGNLLALPPARFHRYHPNFGLDGINDYRRAAFIDTETTGLGGGAGVYCFMVGVGTFEAYQPYDPAQLSGAPNLDATPTHFVVRQFFMRNPAEECALLVALAGLLSAYEMTVTFNGRSFDLPLLRLRYLQNRRFLPLERDVELLDAARPHLDLLMPARRVWRRRLQSCRLINLEQMVLGLERDEDDVPGHLIPELYHAYVQSGHTDAMRRVFYHNHEDIVTMVALAEHLGRAFGDDPAANTLAGVAAAAPVTTVTGMDWLGLGHAHLRAGDDRQAIEAFTRALESVRNPTDRADIYRALGELYKRRRQWSDAVETWNTWITSVPGTDPTPYIELAKYHEWETRDLEQAEMWTAWALHNLRQAHPAARRPGDQRALEHRLARLQRKRSASGGDTNQDAPT